MTRKGVVLLTVSLALAPASAAAQSPINPADLVGTWQLLYRKNLRTGVIDSVMNRRLAWEGFTQNTYHVYEMDLNPTGVTREELKALPPLERQKRWLEAVHYAARGGMYLLDGKYLRFRRVMSGDPNDIGTTPTAIVDSIRGDYMYRVTVPDTAGVQTFQLYRRVQGTP